MSVIVAVKENGVVYMGMDSQISFKKSKRKVLALDESSFKVKVLENGILVGMAGNVESGNKIIEDEDIITLDEDGKLTKRHIVCEIVPKLVEMMGSIGDEEKGEINVTMLLAYGDSLFELSDELDVYKHNEYAAIGSGKGYMDYPLWFYRNLPVRERIVKAMMESAKREEGVDGPFVLIDTKDKKYEIVGEGDVQ